MLPDEPQPSSQFVPPWGIPAWLDPALNMVLTGLRFTAVDPLITPNGQLCQADPTRVALGFVPNNGAPGTLTFYPEIAGNSFLWTVGFGQGPLWFHVFTYGPLVNQAWFTTVVGLATIGVIEVYRLQ